MGEDCRAFAKKVSAEPFWDLHRFAAAVLRNSISRLTL